MQLIILAGVFLATLGVIVGAYLFANRRALAEADAVRSNQSFVGVKLEFAFALVDDNAGLFDRLTLPRMNTQK